VVTTRSIVKRRREITYTRAELNLSAGELIPEYSHNHQLT